VRIGQTVIQRQRFQHRLLGEGEPLEPRPRRIVSTHRAGEQSRARRIGRGEIRIEPNSFVQIAERRPHGAVAAQHLRIVALEIHLMRGGICRRPTLGFCQLARAEPDVELTRHRAGNLALDAEDVA